MSGRWWLPVRGWLRARCVGAPRLCVRRGGVRRVEQGGYLLRRFSRARRVVRSQQPLSRAGAQAIVSRGTFRGWASVSPSYGPRTWSKGICPDPRVGARRGRPRLWCQCCGSGPWMTTWDPRALTQAECRDLWMTTWADSNWGRPRERKRGEGPLRGRPREKSAQGTRPWPGVFSRTSRPAPDPGRQLCRQRPRVQLKSGRSRGGTSPGTGTGAHRFPPERQ